MGSAVKVVGRVARDVDVISPLLSRGRESAVGRSSDRRIQQFAGVVGVVVGWRKGAMLFCCVGLR